jgi:zinc-binding alcohol dehydrogenase/oxidoreductase
MRLPAGWGCVRGRIAPAMRAVRLHQTGGPQTLRVETIPDPKPGPGQILVRITYAALNRRDLFIAQGLYPGIEVPCTLGSDGAGEVAALGPDVSGPPPGTPVVVNPQLNWSDDPAKLQAFGQGAQILGMPTDGTFAEYVVAPASNVYPRPKGLSAIEAAAIPLAGLTAYRAAFTRGRMTKDDVVFIPSIGGGVQTFVLLYAQRVGARTIVTSRSDEKLARASALGANAAINTQTTPNWWKHAREAAGGEGPTLVIDGSGGDILAKALDIAAPSARVVIYGATAGEATVRPFSIFWKQLTVMGTSMGSPADFQAMLALFEQGLKPVIDRTYPLEDAPDAARRLLDAEQFGKVMLAVS